LQQLFVVTHAESRHHVEGRVGGWYDTGLTDRGREQAGQIAGRLKSLTRRLEVEIVSSDLKRAAETAAIIGDELGVTPRLDADLREISYGVAEGQPQEWLSRNAVPPSGADQLDHKGVVGGETRRAVATRVYRAMEAIVARPCETQIIVTHGFALTFVVAAWIGMPLEAVGQVSLPVKSGSITRLIADPYWRNRAIASLGDVSHLTA
jgi:probable phosphoglycerate mutase